MSEKNCGGQDVLEETYNYAEFRSIFSRNTEMKSSVIVETLYGATKTERKYKHLGHHGVGDVCFFCVVDGYQISKLVQKGRILFRNIQKQSLESIG